MRMMLVFFCLWCIGCSQQKEIRYTPCAQTGTTTHIFRPDAFRWDPENLFERALYSTSAISNMRNTEVLCSLISFPETGLSAHLFIMLKKNYGQSVNFNLSDVRLTDVKLENIDRYSPDEYLAKLESDRDGKMALLAFASGMSAYGASHSYSQTTSYHDGNIYTPYGNSFGYGGTSKSYTTHYDPAAANASMANSAKLITRVYDNHTNKISNFEKLLLRASAIEPGGAIIGVVQYKKHGGGWHQLNIDVAGDKHCVVFRNDETDCLPKTLPRQFPQNTP